MMSLFDAPLADGRPGVTDTRFTAAVHDAAVKRGEAGEEDDGTT